MASPQAFLNDLGAITETVSYELGDTLTVIGRIARSDRDAVGDVVIAESTIGLRHALVAYRDHAYWITDQRSLNGTFVNGERIEGESRLKHGDRIRFHRHEFECVMLDMFDTERTLLSETQLAGRGFEATEPPGADQVATTGTRA